MSHSRTMKVTDARGEFSEIVNEAAYSNKRTILTKHGDEKAAVVPINDLRALLLLDSVLDTVEAESALDEARESGGRPLDDVLKELGIE